MGYHPPSRPLVLLKGTSLTSSTYTAEPLLVADYSQAQAISVETVTTGTSLFTVQGSLSDGLTASIPATSWSNMTTITQDGLYTVDPGVRWLRVLRSAIESLSTVRYGAA